MRILFKGTVHPSAIAKSIKTALAVRDVHLGLRRCEEIFARMCGYANWHELRQVSLAARAEHSPKDEIAGEEIAAERRRQFVAVLSGYGGVAPGIAGEVVDEVRPTGTRRSATVSVAPPFEIPPETIDADRTKLRKLVIRMYVIDGERIYSLPEDELAELLSHGRRAPEFAGRRALTFWIAGDPKRAKRDPMWGRLVVRFGRGGQLQYDGDDVSLTRAVVDEEVGRKIVDYDRGKPIYAPSGPGRGRAMKLLGFGAPDPRQVASGIAEFYGDIELPRLPSIETGYEPSPEFVNGRHLYEKVMTDKRTRMDAFRRDLTYFVTDDGPIAADRKWLQSMLDRENFPAFAGRRIPVVETLGGRPYEHLFWGLYMTFDADGRYVDETADVSNDTMYGHGHDDADIAWRRHNTWKPEPETLEPMFLDILARMKLPGGRPLPTLGRHLGGLGSRRKPDPERVRSRSYVWTDEGPKRLTAATFDRDRPDAYPPLAGTRHRYLSVTYFVDEEDGPTMMPHGGFLTFRPDGTVDRKVMMRDRQRWEPTKADLDLVEADMRPVGHPDRRPIPIAARGVPRTAPAR